MELKAGDRIEMHPATDHWMRGDRYGEVRYVFASTGIVLVALDKSMKVLTVHPMNIFRKVSDG